MRFFFYGTLLDTELRRAVLGRMARRLSPTPATLEGFEARIAAGRRYPLAIRRRGAVLSGIVMTLPRRAARRIIAYEGPEYRCVRRAVRLAGGAALSAAVFLASGRARAARTPWRIEDWRKDARRRRRVFGRARMG